MSTSKGISRDVFRKKRSRWRGIDGAILRLASAFARQLWPLLLAALVAADLGLIVLHIAAPDAVILNRGGLTRLDLDHSISEWFEYAKLSFASLTLVWAARIGRSFLWLSPALCIVFLLADNALMVHERFGDLWPREHVAELLFFCAVGAAILAIAIVSCRRAPPIDRDAYVAVFSSIGFLGLFAAGVDALHALLARLAPGWDQPLALVEDGGELITISVLLAICAAILRRKLKPD